ncbi:MAG: nitrogen regulation protein NR(I) [Xanthomonadaceae bacterium]|nr:nitrogen regulation protein NR(I) [Xanthomonadaceae bacterium]
MNKANAEIWIVDDDASIRRVLSRALAGAGFSVRDFECAEAVLGALDQVPAGQCPEVLISDLRMPGGSGLDLLERVRARLRDLPVIIMTAYADLDNTVAALKGGAFEFLPKPFDLDEAIGLVHRALEKSSADASRTNTSDSTSLIGSAPAMQEVFRVIGRLSNSHLNVLLIGESGTGKECISRALHESSPRAGRPFIALNVAAIPSDLLESELFGYEKGAFSGADQARAGYFEQADGGCLFLDEIGDMPPPLQAKLLRVLAEGEFYRLGGRQCMSADVRIIAATNRDLEQAVSEGRFREDLYHRLNVVQLRIPPLKDRRDDVPLLLDHYLQRAADELGTSRKHLGRDALNRLVAYDWPGNIRELVNLCRRLTALVPGSEIRVDDLPFTSSAREPSAAWTEPLRSWARIGLAGKPDDLLPEAVSRLEQCLIEEALKATGGQRAEAAAMLGIGRNTLTRKLPHAQGGSD